MVQVFLRVNKKVQTLNSRHLFDLSLGEER